MSALARASSSAGARMQAALDLTDAEAHNIHRTGVTVFRPAWSGTDISSLEVEDFVRLVVVTTLDSAGVPADQESDEWRRLAGLAYRMLLTGVLAGRDVAG